jgi:acetolactate synthase I/II/III large subunit
VLTHGETSAALMAATDAERTGVPGVVLTSGGPGAAAAVDGVAHASLDRVPLVVVTDRLPEHADRRGYHQWLDHGALYAAVVKASVTLTARAATTASRDAVRTALAETPGPVHLDLPAAEAAAPVLDGATVSGPPERRTSRTGALPQVVGDRITAARRPVVLAGLGCRELTAGQLDAVATQLRAPVLTTYKAKGAIDERSPWAAGIVTGGAAERPLLERADLVLSVGLDAVELFPSMPPVVAEHVALHRSDPPPGVVTAPDHLVLGDLDTTLADLTGSGASTWSEDEPQAHRRDLEDRLAATETSGEGVHPWAIATTLSELLSGHADVTVDAGAHMLPVAQAWRTRRPGGFLISNGLATMGFGLPAAIAVSSATPDRHVVCCTGDGGLLMVAGELATAARVGEHLTVVVFEDRSLSLIRSKQVGEQVGHGVDFPGPDWCEVARGFGLAATRVTSTDALTDAVRAAAAEPGVSLVSVATDPSPYAGMLRVLRG